MFSKEELNRYRKQVILDDIGITGQLSMRQSKVLVIGAGGLGCPVLQYLVAAGIGEIGVVDFDTVEISNLHRQVLYTSNDVGKQKVLAALGKLSEQNPFVKLVPHPVMLDTTNAEDIIQGYDIVVDGCDNFLTRYIVNDACLRLNKPLVYGSILAYEAQMALFNYKGSKNLRDIFPESPDPGDVPDCSENGVLGMIPAITGSMMALEVVNVVLQRTQLANTLILMDCFTFSIRKLRY
jgi:molybdopterin-synthase adenylyltransferase